MTLDIHDLGHCIQGKESHIAGKSTHEPQGRKNLFAQNDVMLLLAYKFFQANGKKEISEKAALETELSGLKKRSQELQSILGANKRTISTRVRN